MLLEFQNFLIHLLYSQKHNQDISGDELHSILSEIDTNQNGSILAICDKPEDRSVSTSMVLYRPQE